MPWNDRVAAQNRAVPVMAGIRRFTDAAGLDADHHLMISADRLRHLDDTSVDTARLLIEQCFHIDVSPLY